MHFLMHSSLLECRNAFWNAVKNMAIYNGIIAFNAFLHSYYLNMIYKNKYILLLKYGLNT